MALVVFQPVGRMGREFEAEHGLETAQPLRPSSDEVIE
jgi:hypothetical protein